jgi:hypothetical protein
MMVGVEMGEGEVYKARFDPDGEDEVMEGQELGVGKSGGTNGRSAAFRDEEEGEEERDWGMLSAVTLRETSQRRGEYYSLNRSVGCADCDLVQTFETISSLDGFKMRSTSSTRTSP